MHDQTRSFSPARFFLLFLTFVTAAVFAFTLQDLLPPARYLLTPRLSSAASPLTSLLPSPYGMYAAQVLSCVSGAALEMAVWFLGGLTAYAFPVFCLAAAYRGVCFGFVLSLLTGTAGPSSLAGADMATLAGYLLATLVLFCFAGGQHTDIFFSRRKSSAGGFVRYGLHFLVCAGAVFWITIFCERLGTF